MRYAQENMRSLIHCIISNQTSKLPCFFHKKLCKLAEQLFKAGIQLREPLVEGVQLIAESQYSEARADSKISKNFPKRETTTI